MLGGMCYALNPSLRAPADPAPQPSGAVEPVNGEPALPGAEDRPPNADITPMTVARRPSSEEVAQFYPRAALDAGLAGEGTVVCDVDVGGSLSACELKEESPAGHGFGQAAMQVAPMLLMRPATLNGVPVPGRVTIPIHFQPQERSSFSDFFKPDTPAPQSATSDRAERPKPQEPLAGVAIFWCVAFAVLVCGGLAGAWWSPVGAAAHLGRTKSKRPFSFSDAD